MPRIIPGEKSTSHKEIEKNLEWHMGDGREFC